MEPVYLKKKLPENFQCIVKKDVENWGCYKNAFLYGYLHEDVYMAQPPNLFILISQTMFANFKSLSMVFVKHQEHGFHA